MCKQWDSVPGQPPCVKGQHFPWPMPLWPAVSASGWPWRVLVATSHLPVPLQPGIGGSSLLYLCQEMNPSGADWEMIVLMKLIFFFTENNRLLLNWCWIQTWTFWFKMFCLESFFFRKGSNDFTYKSLFKTSKFNIDYGHLFFRK